MRTRTAYNTGPNVEELVEVARNVADRLEAWAETNDMLFSNTGQDCYLNTAANYRELIKRLRGAARVTE